MTNQEKLREVFPRTIFIYQKEDDRTCAIMCSDEWLNAEYTESNPNKNGVKTERETVTEFADRCRECGREKVLDKIRTEIKAMFPPSGTWMYEEGHEVEHTVCEVLADVLQIIDKYKAHESEDKK